MKKSIFFAILLGAATPCAFNDAIAGTVATQLTSRQQVSQSQANPLDGDVFGETIDTRTGSTRFSVTDISLPSNGSLNLSLSRRLIVGGAAFEDSSVGSWDNWGGVSNGREPAKEVFGGYWELDIPFMEAAFDARTGWAPNTRCSSGTFSQPTVMGLYPYYSSAYEPKTYANGITVNIPGKGTESLLKIAAGAQVPATGLTYVGSTASGARFSCLASLKNDSSSEGFLAILPDGTKYWFDWMATKRKPSIMSGGSMGTGSAGNLSPSSDTVSPQVVVPLVRAFLYVTRIEDRFGNSLTYTYDAQNPNRLSSIVSSDGASIGLNYNASGQISSAVAAGQTWNYVYSAGQLQQVVLPDNSRWEYANLAALTMLFKDKEQDVLALQRRCVVSIGTMKSEVAPDLDDDASVTITAPSGLKGVFQFREIVHGDSRAPGSCVDQRVDFMSNAGPAYYYAAVLNGASLLNRTPSLYQRVLSGPGLQEMKWTYTYHPAWSYLSACPQPSNCVTTVSTDVLSPDGSVTTYLYGNDYQVNSGKLLQVTVKKAGVVAKTDTFTNLTSAAGYCFPDSEGTDPFPLSNPLFSKNRPLLSTSTSMDGATFNSTVLSFDCKARPLQTRKWSTGMAQNFSKTEAIAYSDNLATWVLDQVASVTNVDTGKVISQSEFDPATALPIRHYSFGVLQETLAYNSDGTLASIKDGRNNVISASDWYRGVPRLVTYPAGYRASATVNDNGTVGSTTNELGYVSNYGYDSMGRLARVIYPTGDAVVWNDTIRDLAPVATAEYGVAAGHWAQTSRTGNGQTRIILDARFHPVLSVTEDLQTGVRSFVVKRFDTSAREVFTSYPVEALTSVNDALSGVSTTYDALGRVVATQQNSELGTLTTTTEYLPGFQTRVTDPRGTKTTTSYQAFDQPSNDAPVQIMKAVGLPEQQTTSITRDVFGKPLTITRSGAGG